MAMEETAVVIIKSVLDYGLLGAAVVVLAYLYWRSQAELRALNALVLEMTRATTRALTENSAAMTAAAASQDRATEANRDLGDLIRSLPLRGGR